MSSPDAAQVDSPRLARGLSRPPYPTGRALRRRGATLAALALIAGIGSLPLAGCSLAFGRPGITITVWDSPRWADESGNRYHWVERKIKEFEASHPFVEVVFQPVEWQDLRRALNAAKEAGALPDIAPLDLSSGGVTTDEIDAGLLEPVDDCVADLDDISPEALAAYTWNGHLWGFPSTMTGHVLLLNLDLFAAAGVEPPRDGKWTWGEFAAACRRLTRDQDKDGKVDTWGFATYVLPGYYEVWPFLYADGARPLSDDLASFTFDSPEGVSALKKLTDLIFVEKAAHSATGSAAVRSVFDLFASAEKPKVAIEPWSAWAIDYLATQDDTIKNFAVAEYPAGKTGEPVTVGGTGGFVVFRQEDTYKRSQVLTLANYLTSANSQYEMARGYRVFPARRKALELDPFGGDPVYRRAAEIIFKAAPLPKHPRWPEIERAIQREVQMALLGIKTPTEALQDAAELVGPLLAPPEAAPAEAPEASPGEAPEDAPG